MCIMGYYGSRLRRYTVGAHYRDEIEEAFADHEKRTEALATGAKEALKKHKQAGNPVVIWRDGEMVWLKRGEIQV